jgi:dihydroorotate dehydrogenase
LNLYKWAARPALFACEAERAHDLMMTALAIPIVRSALRVLPRPAHDDRLRQDVFGLSFAHPLGLAAGLDKQGTATAAWDHIGFAFAEIGTVTPQPQAGNPRPRLFRLPGDRAIINRFGFNSVGAMGVGRNLAAGVPASMRIGINIGKNKDTPNERAADDYIRAVEALHSFADYLVINVSSPNTSGLRDLQERRSLRMLVEQVGARVREVSAHRSVPVLVKVSPDMGADDLRASVDAAAEAGVAGVIATNTTVSRPTLTTDDTRAGESGGLSGAPLRPLAHDACRILYAHLRGRLPIVGVGGIFSAEDAYDRIRSGAALVQLYTALVYEGPGLVRRIVDGLANRLARDGFSHVQEAIGIDVR